MFAFSVPSFYSQQEFENDLLNPAFEKKNRTKRKTNHVKTK